MPRAEVLQAQESQRGFVGIRGPGQLEAQSVRGLLGERGVEVAGTGNSFRAVGREGNR